MSSSLLTPDPGLVFWMIIAFGLVLFILAKFGFPVILDKLDSRKKFIDESLVAAKQAYDKLENVKTQNKLLIEEANRERSQIISDAAKQRDLILDKAKEKAIKEANQIVSNARQQIIQEREEAIIAIRREIAVVSVDIAEKVLRKNLQEKEDQMSMIERLVDEINLS